MKQKLDAPDIEESTKSLIRKKFLSETTEEQEMEEEAIRYQLWIDSERCCSFFSDVVILCEGATEKALIDYLIKNRWDDLK